MTPKTKRRIKYAVLGVLGLAVVGVGVSTYLVRRPPQVWRAHQDYFAATTEQQRAEVTEEVQKRIDRAIAGSLVIEDPDESEDAWAAPADPSTPVDKTVKLKLTNAELIAMVSSTFDQWTAQRGFVVPDSISEPAVAAEGGRLAMAFEVRKGSWSQVFSGYVTLRFRADGMAEGRVDDLNAGSLPVSVKSVGEVLRDNMPRGERQTAEKLGDWISRMEHFEFRPVLELEQRRRARVIDMAVGDNSVTLTLRVQDHLTYKRHNELMTAGVLVVTDVLAAPPPPGQAIADAPTTTD